ncbi:MAG: hypothetical protein ABI867_03455 [Kofleriaceae bacterium]
MARNRKPQPAPFTSISKAVLDHVIGGRLSVSKGPDPQVIRGIKTLAETVGQAGQVMKQQEAEKGAQMQQVMQQMMGRRG